MANNANSKTSSYRSLLVRVAVAVLACWLIGRNLDVAELQQTFASLHVSLLVLASAVFAGGLCLIGLRWWLFMRGQQIPVPLTMAIKLTFLGQFFTNFMPSAVGGDLVRAWYVARYSDKKLQAALGVVVDRLIGLVSTFVLAITSYGLFMRGRGVFQAGGDNPGAIRSFLDSHPVSLPHVFLVVMLMAGGLLVATAFFDLRRFVKKSYGHVTHLAGQLKQVLGVYYHNPLILLFALAVTIALQSLVIVAYWLIGRDLGMTAELQYYFVFFPLTWVAGSVPISIAGLGILEGGLAILFVRFTGAPPEAVIALALCQRLTWIIASIPGMVVHVTGAHRRGAFSC